MSEKPQPITKQLASLNIGQSQLFPIAKYAYLNSLISGYLIKQGLYYRLAKTSEKEVEVTRINKNDRPKRKPELLAMPIGARLLEPECDYRSLHVTIRRLMRSDAGVWHIGVEELTPGGNKATVVERVA